MTLDRTKRYVAALLCAVGLSFLGNTVWADSGSGSETTFTWILDDGSSETITVQQARTRCEACRAQQKDNAIANSCTVNIQICFAVNVTW
jgi:hypothetical protein